MLRLVGAEAGMVELELVVLDGGATLCAKRQANLHHFPKSNTTDHNSRSEKLLSGGVRFRGVEASVGMLTGCVGLYFSKMKER